LVVHLRTLKLIESFQTSDKRPLNPEEQTTLFLNSCEFDAMVECLAAAAAEMGAEGRGREGSFDSTRPSPSAEKPLKPLTIYLATDAVGVRAAMAEKLRVAVQRHLAGDVGQGRAARADAAQAGRVHAAGASAGQGSAVEVDYFDASLPPAHWVLWTLPLSNMTQADWEIIVGTTAEWLFLGSGQTMLMVRGLGGGEEGPPSSFAISAAGFGRIPDVRLLVRSRFDGDASSGLAAAAASASSAGPMPTARCKWSGKHSFNFSSPR
jgi:hypothetical protein